MKASALILTSLVLAAAAQQPATKPATTPPAKPATPAAPKRELSDAERRALQDSRSAAEVREMQRLQQEAQRRAEAGTAEADRVTSKLPDSAKAAANSPEAKAIQEKAQAAAASKDPAAIKALAEQAKEALGEDEGKAMLDAAKKKLSDMRGKSGTGSVEDVPDDEPLKPVPLKPISEPLTPRARPVADTSFDVGADDMIFPTPKEKKEGEPVPASERTISARGNVIVRSPGFRMQSGEFDGVMEQDFDMQNAGKQPAKGNKADIVNPGSAAKNQSPFAGMPFESAVAREKVVIFTKDQDGNPVTARGGIVTFSKKSEAMVLKNYPEARVDTYNFIGNGPDSLIIIYPGSHVELKNCNLVVADGKPLRMADGKIAIDALRKPSASPSPAPATPRPAAAPATAPRTNPPAAPARTP